ncbi:tryptophan--tRNA ligase [Candidatus Microgenomates bacterium]|nr:tryptophan--tRNA ligase [Candidatus Microgenomates bacterium]
MSCYLGIIKEVKDMATPKLYITKEVKDKFSELEEVLMPVFGVSVQKDESILTEKDFRTDDVLTKPEIKAFREFFSEFGVDIKKTPPSVEHLYQRFYKTGRVPHINNVVDICNKVAVETLIPTGVFDLDKIKGDMVMRYSYENEEFHSIGGDVEKLPAGLVVIADEEKILNLFPARDSIFQNVTEKTKNVMILADKVAGISLAKTKEAVLKIGESLGGNKEDLFVSETMNVSTKKPIVKRNVHLKNIATDIMRKAGSTYKFIDLPEDLPADVPSHVVFHKITLKEAVPTMVFRTEKGLIAAQRRADTKVNFNKLKLLAGVSELALATEEDLAQLGAEYGVVPLVGLPMPYFVDKMVIDIKQVYGGSGEKLYALTLPSKQSRTDFECFYQVVSYHGITTPYHPETYQRNIRNVFLDYLGAGLDPKISHISIQLEENVQLSYLLSTIYQVSRLEDLPTYKDKKLQHPDYVNMGLLYYPVLMAADILCYKGELVPVGIDQEPHIEVTREIVRKFNMMYGDTFPEPKRFDTPGRYVPSLLGEGKMSKSVEGSYIALTDDLATIKAKLAKAPTDSGKGETFPQSGGVANLVTFVELFEGRDKAQQLREQYKTTGIRYGDLKAGLAGAIFNELKPIQEKRKYYEAHPEEVDQILAEGKEYSQKIAKETLQEVREKMGLD